MMASIRRLDLHWSRSDALRLAASFVLAVLLWGWVTNSKDPEISRTFSGVQVTTPVLASPLQIVGSVPAVSVRISGPRSKIDDLASADISATLDVSKIPVPGNYNVKIHVDKPDGIWTAQATPARVPIQVDQSVTKQFVLETQVTWNVDATIQAEASVVRAS